MYDQPNALYRCTPVLSIDPIGEKVETVSKKFEDSWNDKQILQTRNPNSTERKLSKIILIRSYSSPPPLKRRKDEKLHFQIPHSFHTLSLRCPTLLRPLLQTWQISRARARVHHRSKFKVSPSVTHTLCLSSFERGRGGDVTNYQRF